MIAGVGREHAAVYDSGFYIGDSPGSPEIGDMKIGEREVCHLINQLCTSAKTHIIALRHIGGQCGKGFEYISEGYRKPRRRPNGGFFLTVLDEARGHVAAP